MWIEPKIKTQGILPRDDIMPAIRNWFLRLKSQNDIVYALGGKAEAREI